MRYHFLYFAPNLSAAWFTQAARRYWQAYRPMVLYDLTFVAYVPLNNQIIITSIARSDSAALIRDQLAQELPHVIHDPLVYDFLDDVQLTLDARVETNQPFGVPVDS
ncbi:MAG: hypothetical protein H6673_14615 [Anaerolineales bacterium]|nr:hypothetical protein [Anaerolineales bacterium]